MSTFKAVIPSMECGKVGIEMKILNLKDEIAELEELLDGADAEFIVNKHIKLLHSYNERKDQTIILLKKIANIEGCTVQDIQSRLNIQSDQSN